MKYNLVRLRQEQSLRFLNAQQPKSKISRQEAEVLVYKMCVASSSMFKNCTLLKVNDGHIALGFNKIQDCLRVKLPEISNSYICRILKSVNIYTQLDEALTYINCVSEATFRDLHDYELSEAKAIWSLVISKKPKKITAKEIKQAIDALKLNKDVIKSKIVINLKLHKSVAKHAQSITDSIGDDINSEQEWQHYVKLLTKHLLENCPILDKREAA